jgi:hypothetical protein
MTDPDNIATRATGPMLDPGERPASSGKRWAILLGFAVIVFGAAASINHRTDKADEPPAASAATAPAPASTNAVLPQGAPAAKSGG